MTTPNHELEVYAVFSSPLEQERIEGFFADLGGLKLEAYPDEQPGRVRAVRLSGDVAPERALVFLRDQLEGGRLRWLELGLRGYGVIKGKREYRPWRKNAYLALEQFRALQALEGEIRYHIPE
jgi:hypothetical protein